MVLILILIWDLGLISLGVDVLDEDEDKDEADWCNSLSDKDSSWFENH